ncbi:MAG: Fic family protein [Candidatus Methanomethylophilaceae archaeon]|nr:Fic family protein [Candidatus Methanomethylophilaceae archaeon]
MISYDYSFLKDACIDAGVSKKISEVCVIQERTGIWLNFYPDAFSELESGRIADSVYCSNAIEHIASSRERVTDIINGSEPRNETELKIEGYYSALTHLENAGMTGIKILMATDLHRILMEKYYDQPGCFRNDDSPHQGYGVMSTVRCPVKHQMIKEAFTRLCSSSEAILSDSSVEPLISIPCIMLDFINLSPFRNGNGRMYRLLLHHLLSTRGYGFLKYVSLDRELLEDAKAHTFSIYNSVPNYEGRMKNYAPFISNIVDNVWKAAKRLDSMFPNPSLGRLSKYERIRLAAESRNSVFSKSDILLNCPGIAPVTIQQALSGMVERGVLKRIGTTKGVRYERVRDTE